MYQKTTIIGNLGRDPEMRYTPSGTPVTNLSVATNRTYKDTNGQPVKETTWFKVAGFGKQAENCAQYLQKGRMVLCEGRLIPDKQTGQRIVHLLRFLLHGLKHFALGPGRERGLTRGDARHDARAISVRVSAAAGRSHAGCPAAAGPRTVARSSLAGGPLRPAQPGGAVETFGLGGPGQAVTSRICYAWADFGMV